jgi:NAD+ synthase
MYEKVVEKIITWLQEEVREADARGVVFGMSGGIDSSVIAVLCKRAFPRSILGILMPSVSTLEEDMNHARTVAKKFNIPIKEVNLSSIFKKIFEEFENVKIKNDDNNLKGNVAIANIQPRLRMLTLYYFANKLNYLVVGSGNKSELKIGYFTKYGDGAADLLPLGDLLKTQVRELAHHFSIPNEIIEKTPSAGLWKGQSDEEEIGLTYEELDDALARIERGDFKNADLKLIRKVQNMIKNSEHKRRLPKICKLLS